MAFVSQTVGIEPQRLAYITLQSPYTTLVDSLIEPPSTAQVQPNQTAVEAG